MITYNVFFFLRHLEVVLSTIQRLRYSSFTFEEQYYRNIFSTILFSWTPTDFITENFTGPTTFFFIIK